MAFSPKIPTSLLVSPQFRLRYIHWLEYQTAGLYWRRRCRLLHRLVWSLRRCGHYRIREAAFEQPNYYYWNRAGRRKSLTGASTLVCRWAQAPSLHFQTPPRLSVAASGPYAEIMNADSTGAAASGNGRGSGGDGRRAAFWMVLYLRL